MIEPGELVQAGTPVGRFGDFSRLIVPFSLGFRELMALKSIPQLEVQLPDLELIVPAALHKVSPSFDAATRKIPAELIIDSGHPQLQEPIRGGMRVELSLKVEEEGSTYLVPQSAVLERYDAHWVIPQNGGRLKVVFLGVSDSGNAVISAPELNEALLLHRVTAAGYTAPRSSSRNSMVPISGS